MRSVVCETLTHIRQTYWIPQGRQLVERIISKCVTCRKIQGPPFRSVPTPPLPKSRVLQSKAFQFTGIDYAGPLYVRHQGNQTSSKVYICLFTWAAVRALNFELVEDQTTQAFLGHSEDLLVDELFPDVSFRTMQKPSKLELKNSKR